MIERGFDLKYRVINSIYDCFWFYISWNQFRKNVFDLNATENATGLIDLDFENKLFFFSNPNPDNEK